LKPGATAIRGRGDVFAAATVIAAPISGQSLAGFFDSMSQKSPSFLYQLACELEDNFPDCAPVQLAANAMKIAAMAEPSLAVAKWRFGLYLWTHVGQADGCNCWYGNEPCIANRDLALRMFQQSSELNFDKGRFELGNFYFAVFRDESAAVQCWLQMNAYEHGPVNLSLGMHYLRQAKTSAGLAQRSAYEKAVGYFQGGAKLGIAECNAYLSLCFQNGCGVKKNKSKALSFDLAAADQGYLRVRKFPYSVSYFNLSCRAVVSFDLIETVVLL
jgi:TPR repeat protein